MSNFFITCTFCDNLVGSKTGKFAQTPVCGKECNKRRLNWKYNLKILKNHSMMRLKNKIQHFMTEG